MNKVFAFFMLAMAIFLGTSDTIFAGAVLTSGDWTEVNVQICGSTMSRPPFRIVLAKSKKPGMARIEVVDNDSLPISLKGSFSWNVGGGSINSGPGCTTISGHVKLKKHTGMTFGVVHKGFNAVVFELEEK